MGLAVSRAVDIDERLNLESFRQSIQKTWTEQNVQNYELNSHQGVKDHTTMPKDELAIVAKHLACFFEEKKTEFHILEIMSGNRAASKFVSDILKASKCSFTWLATDAVAWETLHDEFQFQQCHGVDAVSRFGEESNVLLMITPPPYLRFQVIKDFKGDVGHCDYYACCDYIKQSEKKTRFIIFVGELGASDGTEGMYKFLTQHPRLNLLQREMIQNKKVDIFALPIEKELFIFQTC